MSKFSLGCWIAGAVMLLTVVTIQIVKPASSQIGWDNVNALMANSLQLQTTVEDGKTPKAALNDTDNEDQIGVDLENPKKSASDLVDANQQEPLQDTQQEPQQEPQQESPQQSQKKTQTTAIKQASQGDLININLASIEQLDTLPGIGPSKAKAIIDYRIKYGNFRSLEQLMEVKGIGTKIFAKMKADITI